MMKKLHIPIRDGGIMAPRQGLLILAACLVLCSCRTPHADWQGARRANTAPHIAHTASPPPSMHVAGNVHSDEHAAAPSENVMRMVSHESVVRAASGPAPHDTHALMPVYPYPPMIAPMLPAMRGAAGWHPPPDDEFIRDGGDREGQVRVGGDFTVYGIDPEDTIAHYDTLDGQTRVQPSNRVDIYAPRFAAVRHITVASANRHQQFIAGVDTPINAASQERRVEGTQIAQPVQPEGNAAASAAYAFRDHNRAVPISGARFLLGIDFDELPYEEASLLAGGLLENSDKPRLAESILAARTWTADAGPQVVIEGLLAHEDAGSIGTQDTYRFDMPKGKPRLEIVKLASKQNALSGETVDFTIRYENVGDQPIGNVTIIDNLTARLEYVPDTAQSTLDADFFTVDQGQNALILRWEIKNPLDVGESGVIQFRCRVR